MRQRKVFTYIKKIIIYIELKTKALLIDGFYANQTNLLKRPGDLF